MSTGVGRQVHRPPHKLRVSSVGTHTHHTHTHTAHTYTHTHTHTHTHAYIDTPTHVNEKVY